MTEGETDHHFRCAGTGGHADRVWYCLGGGETVKRGRDEGAILTASEVIHRAGDRALNGRRSSPFCTGYTGNTEKRRDETPLLAPAWQRFCFPMDSADVFVRCRPAGYSGGKAAEPRQTSTPTHS